MQRSHARTFASLRSQRGRTRALAFMLALTALATSELVSMGAASASQSDLLSGLEMLELEHCPADGAEVGC